MYYQAVPYTDPLLHTFCAHWKIPLGGERRETLARIACAFGAIPYENLTKIIGVAEAHSTIAKQTPEEVINGFIRHGTGGTCFPLTLTLHRLVTALGWEAHPIVADRRYGADTHCALIVRVEPTGWHLLDPGYLLTTPIIIPHSGAARYELPLATVELRCQSNTDRVELHTRIPGTEAWKYRLTYKISPVDDETFHAAWDRSFGWEMMTYPIISSAIGDTQVYVQKNTILVRSPTQATRITLSDDALAHEVATRLSLSAEIVRKALGYLRR